MRMRIWVSICLLTLILAGGIATNLISRNVSHKYLDMLATLETHVLAEEWQKAKALLDEMENQWTDTKHGLQAWVHHMDTDDVNRAIKRTHVGILLCNQHITLESMADLSEALDHIEHRDALTLHNFL